MFIKKKIKKTVQFDLSANTIFVLDKNLKISNSGRDNTLMLLKRVMDVKK